jgi:hypothetical protein
MILDILHSRLLVMYTLQKRAKTVEIARGMDEYYEKQEYNK